MIIGIVVIICSTIYLYNMYINNYDRIIFKNVEYLYSSIAQKAKHRKRLISYTYDEVNDINNNDSYEQQTTDFFHHVYSYYGEKFVITTKHISSNKKHCIYIPGNNDYFYLYDMANKLFDDGYNFYAISFPNFGLSSDIRNKNYSTFYSIPRLFKFIDFILLKYKFNQIDLLMGHSTGALISIAYASENKNVNKLILSSPLLDFYLKKNLKRIFHYLIAPIGLFLPKLNFKANVGDVNPTTSVEYNRNQFNTRHKSLLEIPTYAQWLAACSRIMMRIHQRKIRLTCPVIIICSDSSTEKLSEEADNAIDINDIVLHAPWLSYHVQIIHLEKSIHSVFIGIDILKFIK